MAAKRTKKQHFVPRFYLDHFTDSDGMIWTYDKKSDNPAASVRKATPENTAVTTNFYSVQNEDGSYNDTLEDLLAEFESDAAPIYPALLAGALPEGLDKDKMAVFFAALYARSPVLINNMAWLTGAMAQVTTGATLSSRQVFDESMTEMEKERGGETTKEQRDEMFEMMKDKDRFKMAVHQKAGLMAIAAIDPVTDVFRKMHWILVEVSDQHIVTSDNPVVKINPDPPHPIYGDGGFLAKDVFVTIPLSPTLVLEMSWKESPKAGVFKADRNRGRLYNKQRAAFAEQYVYSSRSDSGIGSLAKKNKDNGLKIKLDGRKLSPIEIRRKLA